MQQKAMTTKEVADFLNVSNQMVYNLIKSNELSAFKIGNAVRVLSTDLEKYVGHQKVLHRSLNMSFRNNDPLNFSVQSLCSHYDGFPLLDISFDFPLKKTVCFLGPSGCGKSLLLRSLAGLMQLDGGAIFNGPQRYDTLSSGARRLGYVFQDYALFPHMSSKQNIGFPHLVHRMEKKQLEAEVQKVLENLKFPAQFLHMLPETLPEGIKQLVAIGSAQSNALDLYIMDEPLSHLDAMIKKEMRIFLKALVTELGKTTIYGFNDPMDALVLSDYVGILDDGKLIQFGGTREVYDHPVNLLALETTSLNGIAHIPVEVKNGKTNPLSIPAKLTDGRYTLYFRLDEIEMTEQGKVRVEVLKRKHFDGRNLAANCRLNGDVTVDLLLDINAGDFFSINLKNPFFFPDKV